MTIGWGIALGGLFFAMLGAFGLVLKNKKRIKLPECEVEFGNIKESLVTGRGKFDDLRERSEKTDRNIAVIKADIKAFKDPLLRYLKKNGDMR